MLQLLAPRNEPWQWKMAIFIQSVNHLKRGVRSLPWEVVADYIQMGFVGKFGTQNLMVELGKLSWKNDGT